MPCPNPPTSRMRHSASILKYVQKSQKSCDASRIGQRTIITETESQSRFFSLRLPG